MGAVLVAVLAVGAAPAFALRMDVTDHATVVITRESTDGTGSISARLYYDYKGNQSLPYWDGQNWNPSSTSSFSQNTNMGTVLYSAGSGTTMEIPVRTDYTQQVLSCAISGGNTFNFPIWYRSSVVTGSVAATVTAMPTVNVRGSVDSTITTMPAVALDSSISVDGTLPVEVNRVGLLDGVAISRVLVLGLGVLGVALGLSLRGRRR